MAKKKQKREWTTLPLKKKNRLVQVRVNDLTFRQFRHLATSNGLSVSEYFRQMVDVAYTASVTRPDTTPTLVTVSEVVTRVRDEFVNAADLLTWAVRVLKGTELYKSDEMATRIQKLNEMINSHRARRDMPPLEE